MRVCLLVDRTGLREYFVSALNHLVAESESRLSLVVVNERPSTPPQNTVEALQMGGIATIGYLRRLLTTTPEYHRRRSIDDVSVVSDIERVSTKPIPVAEGLGERLPDHLVEEIEQKADVVIRHGFGILQGRILTGPEHGVLSFHHGDIRRYRGVALGFWNFLKDEDTAGVTLQRLTPQLDGGEIVAFREIDISDCFTWQEVKTRLFEGSIPMLTEGIQNVSRDTLPPQPTSMGELYTRSDVYRPSTLARYLWKNNLGRLRRQFSTAYGKRR